LQYSLGAEDSDNSQTHLILALSALTLQGQFFKNSMTRHKLCYMVNMVLFYNRACICRQIFMCTLLFPNPWLLLSSRALKVHPGVRVWSGLPNGPVSGSRLALL
jgi:hypothetical protein